MAYDFAHLRSSRAIPMDKMVAALNQLYPKMDKPLLSKALNGSYGISLTPEARRMLGETFDPEGWEKRREKDQHKKKCSVRYRMTDEEKAAFEERYRTDGFQNAGECVGALIRAYMERGPD